MLLAADEKIIAIGCGRGVDALTHVVGGHHLRIVARSDHRDRPAAIGEVDVASGGDRRGIGAAHAGEPFGFIERLAGGRIDAGQQTGLLFVIVELALKEERRGHIGRVAIHTPQHRIAASKIATAIEIEGGAVGPAEATHHIGHPVFGNGRRARPLGLPATCPQHLAGRQVITAGGILTVHHDLLRAVSACGDQWRGPAGRLVAVHFPDRRAGLLLDGKKL